MVSPKAVIVVDTEYWSKAIAGKEVGKVIAFPATQSDGTKIVN
jgi:hypothetical protein